MKHFLLSLVFIVPSISFATNKVDPQLKEKIAHALSMKVAVHHWGLYADAMGVSLEDINEEVCSQNTISNQCEMGETVVCELTCYGISPLTPIDEDEKMIAKIQVSFKLLQTDKGLASPGLTIKTLEEFNYQEAQKIIDDYNQ